MSHICYILVTPFENIYLVSYTQIRKNSIVYVVYKFNLLLVKLPDGVYDSRKKRLGEKKSVLQT